MKRTLSELIFADCIFVILLSLKTLLPGNVGWIFYALAFIFPVMLLLFLWQSGEREIGKVSLSLNKKSLILSAELVFPIIFLMLLISSVTTLVMGAFGVSGGVSRFDENIFYAIIVSALAPAIFEEMLFRYLPLRGLCAYSPRLAVIYSAILFSLSHCNLFQIPYALVAGVAFAAIDIAAGSVMPSIIIHFINNVAALIWQKNNSSLTFPIVFCVVIFVFAAISVWIMWTRRKEVKNDFSPILEDKSKVIFTYPLLIYIFTIVILLALQLLT